MREFAVLFADGMWHVMERFEGVGPAIMVRSCPTFEEAVKAVALMTGKAVLIRLVTEE